MRAVQTAGRLITSPNPFPTLWLSCAGFSPAHSELSGDLRGSTPRQLVFGHHPVLVYQHGPAMLTPAHQRRCLWFRIGFRLLFAGMAGIWLVLLGLLALDVIGVYLDLLDTLAAPQS